MSRNDHPTRDEPLWTGLNLISPLGARVSGGLPSAVTGISIDTRTLQPGDLFFAIKGDRSDGHDYVQAAFAAGAAAAVVDEQHADAFAGQGNLFVVRDVLHSLNDLGQAARARSKARVVAITGSVGKTSTKEALRLALTPAGKVHASVASYNNHWGVPLSLARMPAASEFCIAEIGMNHAGEITPLSALVRPHIAVVTTVAPVHLEFFPNVEAIADAKAEIFGGLEPGGIAILNRDNPHYDRLAAAARRSPAGLVASFGAHEQADAQLLSVEVSSSHSMVRARVAGHELSFRLGAPGRHLAENSLAVLLAVHALGADLDQAITALAFFQAQRGRGERLLIDTDAGAFSLIDESYNANPASMRATFATVAAIDTGAQGRRIAVLGDMLELGAESMTLHADLAADIIASGFDGVFLAGPMMQALADALRDQVFVCWQATAEALRDDVLETVRAGDLVVVKGSNGSRMSSIVQALKDRYATHARERSARDPVRAVA